MNRFILAAVAATAGATSATAGGLDRSGQPFGALFDPADTVSFGLSYVNPDVTGSDVNTGAAGSYDAGGDYTTYTWSFTNALNDQFSYALIGDQPFGADIFYDAAPNASNLGGTTADLSSDAITLLGKFQITDRISVFGGPRAQRAGGDIVLNGLAYGNALGARAGAAGLGTAVGTAAQNPAAPNQVAAQQILAGLGDNAGRAFAGVASGSTDPLVTTLQGQLTAAGFGADVATAQGTFGNLAGPAGAFVNTGGYAVAVEDDWGVGLTVGAAYEIPEIALRFAIAYQSEVEHDTTGTETSVLFGGAPIENDLVFRTPQSVNVEFQTGINEQTLVLAGLRWTNWDDFDVVPELLGADLANIDDSYRWTLGVARRFTPSLVGLASLTYERENDSDTVSPLGPTDGQIGLSLGARYTSGNLNISGGINYTKIGDAFAGVADQPVASFEDNSAVGVGLRVSYEF